MRHTQTQLQRSTTPRNQKESKKTKPEERLKERREMLTEAVAETGEGTRVAAGRNAAIMMK